MNKYLLKVSKTLWPWPGDNDTGSVQPKEEPKEKRHYELAVFYHDGAADTWGTLATVEELGPDYKPFEEFTTWFTTSEEPIYTFISNNNGNESKTYMPRASIRNARVRIVRK